MSDIYTVELQGGCGAQSGVVAALAQELAEEARDVAVSAAGTSTSEAAVATAAATTAVSASGRAVAAETVAEAVEAAILAALGGTSLASANIAVASRSLLAAASHSPALPAILTEADHEGVFVWDGSNLSAKVAADPLRGIYVAPASDTTGASGAWVRKYEGPISAKYFNATGGGVANDSVAIAGAISELSSAAVNDDGTYKGSNPLFAPAGHYYVGSTTLDITHTFDLSGASPAGQAGGYATEFRWASGSTGVRVQRYNTSGNRIVGATHHGGDGSSIRNLLLYGGYAGSDGTAHGIDTNARVSIVDVSSLNWEGNALNIVATAGGGSGAEGNANGFSAIGFRGGTSKNGAHVQGADANAGYFLGCEFVANREWGVIDDGFLGNTYISCQFSANGLGSIKTTNANATHVILNCYVEGDGAGGVPSFANTTLILGGQWGAGVVGGVFLHASTNRELVLDAAGFQLHGYLTSAGASLSRKGFRAEGLAYDESTGATGPGLEVGFAAGLGAGYLLGIDRSTSTNTSIKIWGSSIALGAAASGDPADILIVSSTGANVVGTYSVGGTQVVGARQAGTPANATDLASAIALVNSLKAKLVTHGLIS